MTAQVSIFINPDDTHNVNRTGGTGTVAVRVNDGNEITTLFLDNDSKTKAGALSVLARLTAAVEALPDDTHEGQGVLHAYDEECFLRGCKTDPAPVWRTLTFGDLRAGDVIKSDQDDDPETVERVLAYVRTDQSTHYRNADLVLVRHPRPEVGQ